MRKEVEGMEGQLGICAVASGSNGNAVYVRSPGTSLLVDNGLSCKMLCHRMSFIQADPGALSGLLITHEHSDHIKGAGILSRKFNLPIYANARTWEAMEASLGPIAYTNIRILEGENEFQIGDITVQPFKTPHDAACSMGYTFSYAGRKVGIATDLGYMPSNVLDALRGCQFVLLESNHDLQMLLHGPYPASLKQRVHGKYGHLSNDDCANALLTLLDGGTHHVMLGHLSQDNNTPELAYSTVATRMVEEGVKLDEDVHIALTYRDQISGYYLLR